ncbi:hypothetical protein ONZ45_g14873 [Pleurotus djamor]|nr:hypothetical protein ONZ45_g14873 [Pleurotus djamor]
MDSSWSSTPGLPGRYLSEGVSSSLTGGRPRTVSSNSATLSNPRAASIGHINNDNDRTSNKRLDINGLNSQSEDQPEARGSKRGLDDDLQGDQIGDYYYYDDGDEASGPSKRKRDKRARKISLQKGADGQPVLVGDDNEDEMMVDDDGEADDAVGEMRSLARGRKRDRAEAGSTFGGDDDDDSVSEEVEELSAKERRRRKRRTVSKRKSEIGLSLRGRKRDRGDSDNEDSEDYDEESDDAYVSKGKGKHSKKRGKRGSHVHEQLGVGRFGGYGGESGSDVSMDGSGVSSHPSCKGRKIGEEWESHGTHFKVGPNGDRLRRVLIRQERSKFPMPADSEHPDRDAGVEIFVEKWLTDDEYRISAKAQQLAASLTPSSSTEPETPRPEDEEDSQKTFDAPLPPPVGKNLLYEAPGTPSQRRYAAQYRGYSQQNITQDPFRQSVATNVGLRANSRRIAISNTKRVSPGQLLGTPPASPISLSSSMNGSLADSTNTNSGLNNSLVGYRGSPRRTYSKWEKQDMEAAAMRQVREAARRKEKEKEEKERKEREAKEKASAAIATPPIVTLTPAPPTPVPSTVAPTPSPSPFSFGKPDEAKDKAASPAPTPAAPKPASSLGFSHPVECTPHYLPFLRSSSWDI